jgi:hypothetical protein
MNRLPDFTDAERWVVETALKERYGKRVSVELADAEARLDSASPEVTLCPTMYWQEREVEFVIFKVGEDRYRSQFFYSLAEQFGTGRDFDDLAECVLTTLRLQADHEKQRAGAYSGTTGAELNTPQARGTSGSKG